MKNTLRIATRKSPLALWQAEYVKAQLQSVAPDLTIELVPMSTKGDKILDTPLAKVGGKGLFLKELEQAMLDGEADIAVHSMKDVPMEFPEGLGLAAICKREVPFDAFVSNKFQTIEELPQGAVVGTSSLRRQVQLKAWRPDLVMKDLRGNVNTRLKKLDDGEYDAIILAAAGLIRLEMRDRIKQELPSEICLPAGGQGAVGIEARLDDHETIRLLQLLHDDETDLRVRAERALNKKLEGGCQVPIACYAELESESIWLRGLVGSVDGKTQVTTDIRGNKNDPEALGIAAAEDLLRQGAGELLAEVYGSE